MEALARLGHRSRAAEIDAAAPGLAALLGSSPSPSTGTGTPLLDADLRWSSDETGGFVAVRCGSPLAQGAPFTMGTWLEDRG